MPITRAVPWRELAWNGSEGLSLSRFLRDPNAAVSPFMGADKTAPIDPGRQGPYSTCVSPPTVFYSTAGGKGVHLVAYTPGVQASSETCQSLVRDCPLVVLLHANPGVCSPVDKNEYYTQYSELCTHLASFGYVVLSLQWLADEPSASTVDMNIVASRLLPWVEKGGLGLKNVISNQLVIMGHSRGGRFAQVAAIAVSAVAKAWTIKAVVLMSPAYSNLSPEHLPTSYASIGSFLAIHSFGDCDPFTNGGYVDNSTELTRIKSAVWGYEVAGVGPKGNINSSPVDFSKHLVYIRRTSLAEEKPECRHFYQAAQSTRAYVTAFLMGWVRDNMAFRHSYFRGQAAIPSLAQSTAFVAHMHAEPGQLILVNWPLSIAKATVHVKLGAATLVDLQTEAPDGMLSHGLALKVLYQRGSECVVTIVFAKPESLLGYTHITVGLCQKGSAMAEGGIFPIVTFSGDGFDAPFSSVAIPNLPPTPCQGEFFSVSRNSCMEEWSFSLGEIESKGVDLSKGISEIRFELAKAEGQGDASVFLGMIKAIGLAP